MKGEAQLCTHILFSGLFYLSLQNNYTYKKFTAIPLTRQVQVITPSPQIMLLNHRILPTRDKTTRALSQVCWSALSRGLKTRDPLFVHEHQLQQRERERERVWGLITQSVRGRGNLRTHTPPLEKGAKPIVQGKAPLFKLPKIGVSPTVMVDFHGFKKV